MKYSPRILLILALIVLGPISCNDDEGCGPDLPYITFDGFDANFSILGDIISKEIEEIAIPTSSEIVFDLFVTDLAFIAQNEPQGGGSCYAFDCSEKGWKGAKDQFISDISIYTEFDFDSTHPIGSRLDDYCQLFFYTSLNGDNKDISLQKYKSDYMVNGQDSLKIDASGFKLKLLEVPMSYDSLRIHIEVEVNSSKIYDLLSPLFLIGG